MKVDITKVKGSQKRGRVTKEDVILFAETGGKGSTQTTAPAETPAAPKVPPKLDVPVASKKDKVIKLTGFKKAMARSMTDALAIPHDNLVDEFNIASMKEARKAYMDANPGKKITYLPFFVKAFSSAMVDFPIFNSHSSNAKDGDGHSTDYVMKSEHNISLAVDSPSGLLVPNLKSVQRKSILQIHEEIKELVERARKNTLTQDDLTNGTFTVSNIGNIGCIIGTPVIFRPQVGIVALGQIRTLPDFKMIKGESKPVPKEIITSSLSFDHRFIDGATGAKFITRVKQFVENLDILLLNLK